MAYGFGWQKAGIRRNVKQGHVRLLGPSANRSLTEGLAYKGPSRGMVTTKTGMNFSQEMSSLFFGDTSLKYSGSAFILQLSVMDLVGFRAPDNAASLILILRELSPIKVGQEGFGPWGNDCHDKMG